MPWCSARRLASANVFWKPASDRRFSRADNASVTSFNACVRSFSTACSCRDSGNRRQDDESDNKLKLMHWGIEAASRSHCSGAAPRFDFLQCFCNKAKQLSESHDRCVAFEKACFTQTHQLSLGYTCIVRVLKRLRCIASEPQFSLR